jgi:hypothetical protein
MELIDLPPAIFDYEPSNYAVMYAPADEMPLLCGWSVPACARPAKRLVIVWNGLRGAALARALRHEKAHLNGWRH